MPDEPIDLRRVAQFAAVARLSSFTAAAAELHISQQAMSSAIRQLERELGATLIDRAGRRIALTSAGSTLAEQAPGLLAAAESVRSRVRLAAQDRPPTFVVGHTPAITSEEVYELVVPIRRARPEVEIQARALFTDNIPDLLHAGEIDVALRRGVMTPQSLAASVFAYDRVRIAVRAGHRLTQAKRVGVADLVDEQIVVWAPPGVSYYTDFLLGTCRRYGFEPDWVVNPVQGTPPVTAVADNDWVAFVTAPAGDALNGRVRVLELDDTPLAPVQAVWIPHTVSAVRDVLMAGPH